MKNDDNKKKSTVFNGTLDQADIFEYLEPDKVVPLYFFVDFKYNLTGLLAQRQIEDEYFLFCPGLRNLEIMRLTSQN